MKRILTLLLITAVLVCFNGCDNISDTDTENNISSENPLYEDSNSYNDESEALTESSTSTDYDINSKTDEENKQKGEVKVTENQPLTKGESVNESEKEVIKDSENDTEKFQKTDGIDNNSQNVESLNTGRELDVQIEQGDENIEKKEEADKSDEAASALIGEADIAKEADMLNKSPAPRLELLYPEASGVLQVSNEYVAIDYSNASDGYIMVKYYEPCESRIKAQLKGATTTYSYNITPGIWEVFPLSHGSGKYTLTVYRNVVDSKYAAVLSASFDAVINDEFTPFLYPNQYVNYSDAPKTVDKAYELTKYQEDNLTKLSAVYDFVVNTIVYDKEKAKSVSSGYLPALDSVLDSQKGICFDYAALMTGMLRSQGIPCKLVVGYAGSVYHAWISVWTQDSGWIDGAIYFDGISWHRMDPTFASSSGKSDTIMQYIGDGKNYTEKYLY